MKRLFVIVVYAVLVCPALAAGSQQFLAGHWEGAVVRNNAIQEVELQFDLSSGELQGTYNVPAIGLFGEPIDSIEYSPPNLKFRIVYGMFTALVDSVYHEITGGNERWNPPVQIDLKRIVAPPAMFSKVEITFASDNATLAGTLYLPRTPPPYPAIVFLHGSSTGTREKWVYRSQGDVYSQYGYACLVFDRRGEGESEGEPEPSLAQQARDAVAALEFLRAREDIDEAKTGLFVASQSGWVAPLACRLDPEISFVIMSSGPAVSVQEQERQGVEFGLRAEGYDDADIAAALRYTDLMFETANSGEGWDAYVSARDAAMDEGWFEYVQFADSVEELGWFRDNNYDPAEDLGQIACPVICLYGENDTSVPPSENAELMRGYLEANGNPGVKVVVFPNGSHLIEVWNTLRGDEWNWPEHYWFWSRRAPLYYETIVDWLNSNVGN